VNNYLGRTWHLSSQKLELGKEELKIEAKHRTSRNIRLQQLRQAVSSFSRITYLA
jgi:hypothetical protein